MKDFFKNNWITVLVGSALILSILIAIQNNSIINHSNQRIQGIASTEGRIRGILSNLHQLDLGLRGYAIVKDDQLLLPYDQALVLYKNNFNQLDSALRAMDYPKFQDLSGVVAAFENYIVFINSMIETAKADDLETVREMLKLDKGKDLYENFYLPFANPANAFLTKEKNEASRRYKNAIRNGLIIQVSIVLFLIPALFIYISQGRKERNKRTALLHEVQRNNLTYVFNPGEDTVKNNKENTIEITDQLIENMQKASAFIKDLSSGNYDVQWKGLTEENMAANKDTLAGNLVNLRKQLLLMREEDRKRNWINEGLAKYSEIVRNNQQEHQQLVDNSVTFMVNYIKAQQGSLYILHEEGDQKFLELESAYAFDKKKWINKRIKIGAGLLGQTFIEGEPVHLKEVPQGYLEITSGLGAHNATNLIIIPFKYDLKPVAVIEMASLYPFETHHLEFLSQAGNYLASAIINSKNTEQMKNLLDKASKTEAEFRSQEAAMRQNMEELQATQEELLRKEKEFEKKLSER